MKQISFLIGLQNALHNAYCIPTIRSVIKRQPYGVVETGSTLPCVFHRLPNMINTDDVHIEDRDHLYRDK